MGRRLDDTDLNNLEAAAHGDLDVGVLAHPVDILRLVEEVRWYKESLAAAAHQIEALVPVYGPSPLRAVYEAYYLGQLSREELYAALGLSSSKNDDGDTPTVVKEGN